jgi:hypothetical protein
MPGLQRPQLRVADPGDDTQVGGAPLTRGAGGKQERGGLVAGERYTVDGRLRGRRVWRAGLSLRSPSSIAQS